MSQSKIAQVAQILDNAAHTAQEVDQFAPGHFTLPEAYEIQRASIDHRVQRGEKMVGIKLDNEAPVVRCVVCPHQKVVMRFR